MFGLIYPLGIRMAQLFFHDHANGQLIERDGKLVDRESSGRHSPALAISLAPSAAGAGYDPTSSGGSYLAHKQEFARAC